MRRIDHLVGERDARRPRRRPRPARSGPAGSASPPTSSRADRKSSSAEVSTMRAFGNAGLQWPSSSTTAVRPMPSRWDSATTSTDSGGKPAAVMAESTASWWPMASGPVRMNGSAAPQGSTTMTRPSDSITQIAWPTSSSPSAVAQLGTPQSESADHLLGREAGRGRVERHVEVRHPRQRRRTDLELRHLDHRRSVAGSARGGERVRPTRQAAHVEAGAGEAQLVAVGVADVEVALAPRRVGRLGHRLEPGADDPRVDGVDVVDPEDHPAPHLRGRAAIRGRAAGSRSPTRPGRS